MLVQDEGPPGLEFGAPLAQRAVPAGGAEGDVAAGSNRLAGDMAAAAPQRRWSVPWARWQPLDSGQLLGHDDNPVRAVSAVDTPSGTVVVSASASAIRAWRLADSSPAAPSIRELPSPITAMVALTEAGEVIVLTLHEDGQLRRATLGAAAAPQTLARGREIWQGLWLIRIAGQPAVVTTSCDDAVEVLSVTDGHPAGLPPVSVADSEVLAAAKVGSAVPASSSGRRTPVGHGSADLGPGYRDGSRLTAAPSAAFPGSTIFWAKTGR